MTDMFVLVRSLICQCVTSWTGGAKTMACLYGKGHGKKWKIHTFIHLVSQQVNKNNFTFLTFYIFSLSMLIFVNSVQWPLVHVSTCLYNAVVEVMYRPVKVLWMSSISYLDLMDSPSPAPWTGYEDCHTTPVIPYPCPIIIIFKKTQFFNHNSNKNSLGPFQ